MAARSRGGSRGECSSGRGVEWKKSWVSPVAEEDRRLQLTLHGTAPGKVRWTCPVHHDGDTDERVENHGRRRGRDIDVPCIEFESRRVGERRHQLLGGTARR